MSKARPIIFSGEMVRALLDGRKTMTRRVVKKQHCPYGQPGDLLWVRETWRQAQWKDGILYRADKARSLGMDEYSDRHKWKPSIFMPRKASRLTLEITDIRMERVQDITTDDAIAEGIKELQGGAKVEFHNLWDSINAKRGYGWKANPRVWVVVFQVHRGNVDEINKALDSVQEVDGE